MEAPLRTEVDGTVEGGGGVGEVILLISLKSALIDWSGGWGLPMPPLLPLPHVSGGRRISWFLPTVLTVMTKR